MSKNKKKKNNSIYMVFIVIGALCGFFGAWLMDKLEESGTPSVTVILFVMGIFLVSFFIVPIIHETGHLVMGLLTGYDFVSFRIGSLTFIKENGRLVRRKYNISGTYGQCVLSYKTQDDPQNIPYFWYHFGGVFFNFLTVLICLPFIVLSKNEFVTAGTSLFALLSAGTGIINIIPTKSMGIGTDGYNLLIMKSSPADRAAQYKIMMLNALQYQGVRLEDMPADIVTFSEEEKNCKNGAAFSMIEANLFMNRHDFMTAEEKYRAVTENEDTYGVYINECKCEMLFCMIMNGRSAEEINSVYDKDLKQYIEATGKTYITRKRLMYAYYLIVEKDREKAEKEYALAEKMEKTYPAKGEYLSEMSLIEYIRSEHGAV